MGVPSARERRSTDPRSSSRSSTRNARSRPWLSASCINRGQLQSKRQRIGAESSSRVRVKSPSWVLMLAGLLFPVVLVLQNRVRSGARGKPGDRSGDMTLSSRHRKWSDSSAPTIRAAGAIRDVATGFGVEIPDTALIAAQLAVDLAKPCLPLRRTSVNGVVRRNRKTVGTPGSALADNGLARASRIQPGQ